MDRDAPTADGRRAERHWARPSAPPQQNARLGPLGPTSNFVLGLVVASLAAVGAIILAVLGQSYAIFRLTEGAVFLAGAAAFRLIAHRTNKFFGAH